MSKIRQSMRISLKNTRAKFHQHKLNYGLKWRNLRLFLKSVAPTRTTTQGRRLT